MGTSSIGIAFPALSILGPNVNTWKSVAMVIETMLIAKSSPGQRLHERRISQTSRMECGIYPDLLPKPNNASRALGAGGRPERGMNRSGLKSSGFSYTDGS